MTRPGVAGLTRERLLDLYVGERLSYRAIGRELGCSDLTVASAVRRFELERGPAPPSPPLDGELAAEIVRLYRSGLNLREVAGRTGLPRDRIAPVLRKQGVRLRKRGSRPQEHLDPARLRADYEEGASLRTLALRERTDDGAIRDALLRAGTVLRRSGGHRKWASVLTEDYLRQRYLERGISIRGIAEEVGCHSATVREAMRDFDIGVRQGGAPQ